MSNFSLRKFELAIGCLLITVTAPVPAQNGGLLNPQSRTLLNQPAKQCTIGLLNLRLTTGKDDLRSRRQSLDVEVHFANGDMQTAPM